MAFAPVDMVNSAGHHQTANSWSEYNQFLWDGWWASSSPPPAPPTVESRLKDVEAALAAGGVQPTTDTAKEGYIPSRLSDVRLKAALVPFWAAAETVTAGTVRMSPAGVTITRNANGTTRGSYDATEQALWAAVSGSGGGGGGAVSSVAGRTGAVVLSTVDVSGLGSAASQPTSAFDASGAAAAAQAAAVQRANHTGTQSADSLVDGTTNKAFLATERTKLTGIATAATANATDAALRDRSTHTGTQAASTVTGLAMVATSGAYSDLGGKPTIPDGKHRNLPGYYVGAFAGLPVDVGVMDATFTSGSTVIQNHQIALECTDLRVVLPHGWKVSTASTVIAETASPSSEPVKVSIQVGTATYPVTFNGARTPTIDPGGRLVSDPIGGLWTVGTQLKVRILNGQINGASYPLTLPATGPGINPVFTDNKWSKNTDVVDATTVGTAANASDNLWGAALIGRPTSATPFSLGCVGDSITHGTGDSNATGGALSWFTRATNSVAPGFRFARNGQWASAVAAVAFYSMPMMSGCSHAMVLLGTNDLLNNTRTYAQIIGDLTTIYRTLRAAGVKPVGVTIPPRTSSTDAWATTTNQTVDKVPYQGGASSIRSQVNAWIRAGGATYLAGYFELADVVESARDSGLWQPNMTGDGTHPNVTGHTAIGAAVNLSTIAAM